MWSVDKWRTVFPSCHAIADCRCVRALAPSLWKAIVDLGIIPSPKLHLQCDVLMFTDHSRCHYLSDLSHGRDYGRFELEDNASLVLWS